MTAVLASIGTAGVPGSGMIMLAMVLQSVGLPVEGVALVAGVDRILDMMRTTVNVTGDAAVGHLRGCHAEARRPPAAPARREAGKGGVELSCRAGIGRLNQTSHKLPKNRAG